MEDSSFITKQRWSALWNGVIIGMGFFTLLSPPLNPLGLLPLGLGIVLERMQRKRLTRDQ